MTNTKTRFSRNVQFGSIIEFSIMGREELSNPGITQLLAHNHKKRKDVSQDSTHPTISYYSSTVLEILCIKINILIGVKPN